MGPTLAGAPVIHVMREQVLLIVLFGVQHGTRFQEGDLNALPGQDLDRGAASGTRPDDHDVVHLGTSNDFKHGVIQAYATADKKGASGGLPIPASAACCSWPFVPIRTKEDTGKTPLLQRGTGKSAPDTPARFKEGSEQRSGLSQHLVGQLRLEPGVEGPRS